VIDSAVVLFGRALVLAVLWGAPSAQDFAPGALPPGPAHPVSDDAPDHRFSLSAGLGLGELRASIGDSTAIWGRTYALQISADYALTSRFVLFGEFYDAHIFNPASSDVSLTDYDLRGFGPGVRSYVTSDRIFFSYALLLSRYNFKGVDETNLTSRWAPVSRFALGKEWRMSPNWSVALAGDVLLGPPLAEFFPSALTVGYSLLVSASYKDASDSERMGIVSASSSVSFPGGAHDEHGLYVDARVGMGALWVSSGYFSIKGMSVPVGLSVGHAVARDLVLFGDFSEVHMYHPASSDPSLHLSALDLVGAGLGARYYLTPRSFFVSGSVLASRLTYDGTSDAIIYNSPFSMTSRLGAIARFSVGKEWVVSPDWTVGMVGELLLGKVGQGDSAYGDGANVPRGFSLNVSGSYHSPIEREFNGSEGTDTPPIPPAGFHTHDGLYLNASLGLGWLRAKYAPSSSDWGSGSGSGLPAALSVGFAFANSLVLFAEFYEMQVRNPSGDSEIVDLEWQGVGPGLKYYLMPVNIFLSSSLLVSQFTAHNSTPGDWRYGLNLVSDWGITGRFSLGKEWWISSNWGLGIAGEIVLGRMGGGDEGGSYSVKGLSLLASASFN